MALRHRFSPGLPFKRKFYVIIETWLPVCHEIGVFWIYKFVSKFLSPVSPDGPDATDCAIYGLAWHPPHLLLSVIHAKRFDLGLWSKHQHIVLDVLQMLHDRLLSDSGRRVDRKDHIRRIRPDLGALVGTI